MYIIVDERNLVAGGYASGFDREGVSTAGIDPGEFKEWIGKVSDIDMRAVEAFLIGDCSNRETLPKLIRERSKAPVLCLNDRQSLDETLDCSPPALTTCCASRCTCAKSSPGSARSVAARSASRAT